VARQGGETTTSSSSSSLPEVEPEQMIDEPKCEKLQLSDEEKARKEKKAIKKEKKKLHTIEIRQGRTKKQHKAFVYEQMMLDKPDIKLSSLNNYWSQIKHTPPPPPLAA
jgi:hypothetical protein